MHWIILAVAALAVLAAREKPTKKLSDLAREELANQHDGFSHFVIFQDTNMHNRLDGRYTSLDDAKTAIRDPWKSSKLGVYFVYSYQTGDIVDRHAHLT